MFRVNSRGRRKKKRVVHDINQSTSAACSIGDTKKKRSILCGANCLFIPLAVRASYACAFRARKTYYAHARAILPARLPKSIHVYGQEGCVCRRSSIAAEPSVNSKKRSVCRLHPRALCSGWPRFAIPLLSYPFLSRCTERKRSASASRIRLTRDELRAGYYVAFCIFASRNSQCHIAAPRIERKLVWKTRLSTID